MSSDVLTIGEFIQLLNECDEDIIEQVDITCASGFLGQDAAELSTNKRLYAVLKPTKEELIERICDVLKVVPLSILEVYIQTLSRHIMLLAERKSLGG